MRSTNTEAQNERIPKDYQGYSKMGITDAESRDDRGTYHARAIHCHLSQCSNYGEFLSLITHTGVVFSEREEEEGRLKFPRISLMQT